MNDFSSSSKNTEIPGQMSFEDMTSDSVIVSDVSPYEIVVLIHELAAILQRHLESNHADTSGGEASRTEYASSDDLGHSRVDGLDSCG